MLVTGIKSKPVYEPLQADVGGRYHLLLGVGAGAGAVLRVAQELRDLAPASFGNTRVLLAPHASATAGGSDAQPFKDLGLADVTTFDSSAALLETFRQVLDQSLMGTRLYVAGPESFIGLAMKSALEYDLNKDEIRAEDIGSLARRVYCIHCRTTAEEVTTNIVECPGCKRWLMVRDHYSRRIAAYMGVMVDAEAPGERPEIKQVFL
jgi:dimethylamine monooxygenase subunit C